MFDRSTSIFICIKFIDRVLKTDRFFSVCFYFFQTHFIIRASQRRITIIIKIDGIIGHNTFNYYHITIRNLAKWSKFEPTHQFDMRLSTSNIKYAALDPIKAIIRWVFGFANAQWAKHEFRCCPLNLFHLTASDICGHNFFFTHHTSAYATVKSAESLKIQLIFSVNFYVVPFEQRKPIFIPFAKNVVSIFDSAQNPICFRCFLFGFFVAIFYFLNHSHHHIKPVRIQL